VRWIPHTDADFAQLTKSLITIATDSPQDAINYLLEQELIPSFVRVQHLNARAPRSVDESLSQEKKSPAVDAVIDQLRRCTSTEFGFLNYLERSRKHYFNLPAVKDETLASLLIERGLAH
jgi:hypothetical protein